MCQRIPLSCSLLHRHKAQTTRRESAWFIVPPLMFMLLIWLYNTSRLTHTHLHIHRCITTLQNVEMINNCNNRTLVCRYLYITSTLPVFFDLCAKWKPYFSQEQQATVKESVDLWSFFHPQVSPPHLTDPWKKPCRCSQQEQVRGAGTGAPQLLFVLLESCWSPSVHATVHDAFLTPPPPGLHETLALLTSQLRPDANHKEDLVFLKDVFSERSLGYLMKVRN